VSWSNWSGSGRRYWRSGGRGSSGWSSGWCWFGGFAGFGLFGDRCCNWGGSGRRWCRFGIGNRWRCNHWGCNWCWRTFGARSNFGHWRCSFSVFDWSCFDRWCHWRCHWSGVGRWGGNRFGGGSWRNWLRFRRASESWSGDETHGDNEGFSNIFHCNGLCTCCAGWTLANPLFSRSRRGDAAGQIATWGKLPRRHGGQVPVLPAQ
jgi:hypothetical protein